MRRRHSPPQYKITVVLPMGLYCYDTDTKHRCKFLSTFADIQSGMMAYNCTYYNVIWICLNGVPIKHNKCVGYFDYGSSTYDYKFNTDLMDKGYNGFKNKSTKLDETLTELAIAEDKIKTLEGKLKENKRC